MGGDEFTIILEEIVEDNDAKIVAHRVLNALSKPINIEGHEDSLTISVGISMYPDDGEDIHMLLKNADTALYHTKEQDRNTYRFYKS